MQAILTMDSKKNGYFDNQDRSNQSNNLLGGLMATLVVTVIVASFVWMMKPDTMPIRQVHIEGEFLRLDTNRLRRLVAEKVRGGFFYIDVVAIRNALLVLPWVNDASVHRVWPEDLRVAIKEQIAVVRWNETGLLNEQGQYFSPQRNTFPPSLPLLEGPEESQELLLKRFKLLKQTYGLSVAHLKMDERRAWTFKLENGLSIVLGKRDFENRIKRFVNVVINNLGKKTSQIREIDMRYTNGFAVRWK